MGNLLTSEHEVKIENLQFEHRTFQRHEGIPVEEHSHSHEEHEHTPRPLNVALEALERYKDAKKVYTLKDGSVAEINNLANASQGYFLKKDILLQLFNELQLYTENDCIYVGFGIPEASEGFTGLRLIIQKAKYNPKTEMMSWNFPEFPMFSTIVPSEAGHIIPPPGNPEM